MNPQVYAYLWITAGVIVAVIFPVLRALVTREFGTTQGDGLPPWAKRYLILFGFSLVTALICLAIWDAQNTTGTLAWYTAFLLGFGWESTVEKFFRP